MPALARSGKELIAATRPFARQRRAESAWHLGSGLTLLAHHLNPSIPFYRLPEAMDGVAELQHPGRTSLRLADIAACLRLRVWDAERHSMGNFPE